MDANKLKVLQEEGYKIQKVCALCTHGGFKKNGDEWGLCAIHVYEHLKHSDETRNLSINKFGTCPEFKLSDRQKAMLGDWTQFIVD